MAKIENKELKVEMQIRAIELLNSTLNFPASPDTAITNYNFNIGVESKTEPAKKLVFVIVNVQITNEERSIILGFLSVSCIYEIINFEELIRINTDGKVEFPQLLAETLNSISISTVRGVMYSTFKGTFLHSAILPIIDPKQVLPTPQENV